MKAGFWGRAPQIKMALAAAAFRDCTLQVVSRKINACYVQMFGARRAMCSGFGMRSFVRFLSQPPRFSAPGTYQMEGGAPGASSAT